MKKKDKKNFSEKRIHLVKNSGTRANGSSMEFRDGLSAIASPRTVLSGCCNGEPIVSPLVRRVQQSLYEMSPRLSQPVTHGWRYARRETRSSHARDSIEDQKGDEGRL